MKELVVNADDFGKSERVNKRITRSIVEGAVTSTSIMVNTENFTKIDIIESEDIGWGIHLNITEGKPVRDDLNTIVDNSGDFLGFKRFLLAYIKGEVNTNEIKREFEAQIEKARNLLGREPDHLNSHHHIHMLPGIYSIAKRNAEKETIGHLRCSKEVVPLEVNYIRRSLTLNGFSRTIVSMLIKNVVSSSSDYSFAGIVNMGRWDAERMNAFLSANNCEKIELCVHPEYDCDLETLTDSFVLREMKTNYKMTDFR